MKFDPATLLGFVVTAFVSSSLAHATSVTIFEDNFDSHALGAQIDTISPPIGTAGNYQIVGGTGANNIVQDAVNNGGYALATTRSEVSGPQYVNGHWDAVDGLLAGPYIYTITYDVLRSSPESNAGFGIDIGYGVGTYNPTLLHGTGGINNQLLYRDSGANAFLDTGYTAGYGGWETYEIVLTMSAPDGADKIYGTYDVFLTRDDPNNNEGLLAKTLIVDDATAYTNGAPNNLGLGRISYYTGPPETGSGNDSVVYFDNISVVRSAIAGNQPGDANGDGMVNLADLQILGDNWQSTTATWAEADFTGDGNVNLADLQIIGDNWGFGVTPDASFDEALAGVAIPEPGSLALLGIGAVALLRRRANA